MLTYAIVLIIVMLATNNPKMRDSLITLKKKFVGRREKEAAKGGALNE